ncbi:MAG: PAS domain S-box protein, partial [Chloroflexota bacterium]|nr:PAS domain S-box protein [Chloroflexota bacterium]
MHATEARSTGQQHTGRIRDGAREPGRHRILIVEDDPGMRALLREAMHDAGLQVAEARDGRAGLDAFLELRPDLILLDARLPQLDGFETCRQLRELPGGVTTPVLMITALDDTASVEQAFAVGVTDFISKPVHVTILQHRVRRLLAARDTEAVLRESEARFRTLADTAPVLIWMADRDGGYTFFNEPWLAFTGRRLEQELGDGWTAGVHPDDREHCLATYREAFRARQPFTLEYHLRHADGTYRWVVDTGIPHLAPDGTFVGYIGSCTDITERKQVEDKLRQSRDQLAIILHGIADGITVQDPTGHLIYANDAAARIVGYPAAQALLKAPLADVMQRFEMVDEAGHPFPLASLPGRLALQGMANPPETIVRFRVTATGEERWSRVNATPIFDARGQVQGAINIFHDITEHQRAAAALRESEARLAGIVGSAMDAIISVDAEQHIVVFNAAAEQMFRCSAADVLGQPIDRFIPVHLRKGLTLHIHRFSETRATSRSMQSLQPLTALRADGEAFPIEATISQLEVAGHTL